MTIKKRQVVLGAALLLVLAHLGRLPDSVVVNHEGGIRGVDNWIRMKIHGGRFWNDQLSEIEKDLAMVREFPDQQEASRRLQEERQRKADARVDAALEEHYRRHPELRPSQAEKRAERLRRRAEKIEQMEADHFLEALMARQERELIETRTLIRRYLRR